MIAAVATICRIPSFLHPLVDWDEAQYASIAELLRTGGRLYGTGGVDNKPPGIYWTYEAIFALCGRYAMWAVHALALIVAIATAWLVARIAARVATERSGTLAGIACACFGAYPRLLGANTELFMMLPLTGVMLLALQARHARRWWPHLVGCGALLVVAAGYKQTALPTGLIIVASVIGTPRPLVRLATAGIGLVGALALGLVAVWQLGSIHEMWHWCAARIVGSYWGSGWAAATWVKLVVGFGPIVACTAILWLAAARGLRGVRTASAAEKLCWLWLAISVASAAAPLRFYGHYFVQILPAVAVVGGVELDRAWSRASWRAATLALLVVPGTAIVAYACVVEPLTDHVGAMSPDLTAPAAWVKDHTQPDARIFVWDTVAAIYVLADRLPASRFVGFMRGAARDQDAPPSSSWDTSPEVWPALADDFAAHPPAVVIDASTADYLDFGRYPISRFPAVAALIARDYAACAVVERFTIYCRSR